MMDSLNALHNDDKKIYNFLENEKMEQVSFLQDQVRRLTSVVREYQMKYPPINEKDVETAPLAPWMTDASLASPLFAEYDNNIKALKEQIKYYKDQFNNIQEKSREIVQENDRLHQELRRSVENQLDVLQQTDGLSNNTHAQLDQLQHKIKVISEEKNRMDSLYQNAINDQNITQSELNAKVQIISTLTAENTHLQEDLKHAREFAESSQKNYHKLQIEYEKFINTAQLQDSELDDLRAQMRKVNVELKTSKSLCAELQSHNVKLKDHLKCMDKKDPRETLSEKSAEGTIRRLQNEMFELDSRVISYSKELEKVRVEKIDLEDQLAIIQKKNMQIEENEYQAILRVRDSVQLVENALLEREQAFIREQQKSNEVLRLQEAINKILKESEDKVNSAISGAKDKTNKQVQQLLEELHYQEIEAVEKQVAFEKLQREKISLQNQLDKIYQEESVEVTKSSFSIDELQKKLSKVELNRDECLLQLDILQMTLRQYKARIESDKEAYTTQLTDLRKQTQIIKDDFDEVSESRLKILNEVNTLKKELNSRKENNIVRDTTCASQVSSLQQKLDTQKKEYEARLTASENMNKDAMNELRTMLATQQKNASKWKEEARVISQNYEKTVSKLKVEISSLKRKNTELDQVHSKNVNKIEDVENECASNQAALDKLKTLYSNAEEEIESVNQRMQLQKNREKQMAKEKQLLVSQIDKLKLAVARPTRLNTIDQQWDSYLEGFRNDIS